MSSKVNAERKAVALKNKKQPSEAAIRRSVQPLGKQPPVNVPPGEALLYDNCSTTVQVTVKTQGRKRTSMMVSGNPMNQKAIEEKKKASGNGDANHNWSRILEEQNRVTMKQNLRQSTQHCATGTQSSKSTRHSTGDSKEARKSLEVHRSQRYELDVASKHLDEIPVKQGPPSRKSMRDIKTILPSSVIPSSTSIASSMESIIVVDRAVQCGGIFDCSNDRFGVFNPVRTLGFLMKELEGLVRDDRSSKILSEMEQALLRIPTEPGKPTPADVDAIALRAQLEASTAKLETTSRKLNATCETLRDQRDSLQQQVQKQALLLEEARQREADLETDLKKLRIKLDEVTKAAAAAQKTIEELKADNRRIETLQKMTADLRTELNEQIEVSQQRFMEGQYLRLEKEKLVVLSAFKDSQLVEHRTAVKELQNLIHEQLTSLQDAYKDTNDSPNRQNSMLQGGKAHSSPTPTSSEHSNLIQSWQGLSDISLSTVEQNTYNSGRKKNSPIRGKSLPFHREMAGDSERKRTTKDVKTQLEFISLPGGETSHTISLPNYKGEETKRHSNAGIGDEVEVSRDQRNNLCDIVGGTAEKEKPISTDEMDGKEIEKNDENGVRSLYKPRKSSFEKTRKHRSSKERSRNKSVVRDDSKENKGYSLSNPIDFSMKEQFQNIFRDMREQSRIPVNIPSPPRHYPHPDWSDSSLPSISGVSESHIV